MHACTVIFQDKEQLKSYVNKYYLTKTYIRVYSHVINQINESDMQLKADTMNQITPNEFANKKRGKKQKMRIKELEELERATNLRSFQNMEGFL